MSDIELSIWAAMLGAVLIFFVASLAEVIRYNNLAAWRGLILVLLTGGSSVLMSGLPEHLAGLSDPSLLMPAKISFSPLSGALSLFYLGHWLGRGGNDERSQQLVISGSMAMCCMAFVLLIWVWIDPQQATLAFKVSAITSLSGALLAISLTIRAVWQGDRLASIMSLACVCLTLMVALLYAKGLALSTSYWLWAIAACMTVAFFMLSTNVAIQRNREQRHLAKLALGISQNDEVTGLPVGAHLLSKIDDALWRSNRVGKGSVMIAIWVDNLYQFNDRLDHSVEQEIRHILTARIRRVLGFQHVLGLQESRCFIAAISRMTEYERVISSTNKLLSRLCIPMKVGALQGQSLEFTPSIGIGLILMKPPSTAQALQVIDQVQQLARQSKDRIQTLTLTPDSASKPAAQS